MEGPAVQEGLAADTSVLKLTEGACWAEYEMQGAENTHDLTGDVSKTKT